MKPTMLPMMPPSNNPQSNLRYAGRVAGVFGLKGELKCDPTSAGRTVFIPKATLTCEFSDGAREGIVLASVREHQGRPLLRLRGVDDATQAHRYIGAKFFAQRDRFILEAGEFLDEDLVGCELVDERGAALGVVEAVEHFPGQDMLVVGGQRVPMVSAFIKSVDTIEKRQILVDLPLGLLEPSKAEEA